MSGGDFSGHENGPALLGGMRSNRGVAVILLAITGSLILSIWFSDWAHRELRDGFTLGFFPLLALFAMAVQLLIMLFDAEAKNVTPEIMALRPMDVVLAVAAIVFISLMFISIGLIGFVPALWILVSGGALILGHRPVLLAMGLGLVTAVALRFLLLILDVAVSDGPLSFIFGA